MHLTGPELIPAAPVLNTTSREQQINIPFQPISTDDLNHALSLQEHEINIPDTPPGSSDKGSTDDLEYEINIDGAGIAEPSPPRHRACRDLIVGSTEEYMNICVPLHEAAITGNWEIAKAIFVEHPQLVRFAITADGDTTLHVASAAEPTKATEDFVKHLVSWMKITDLEIENDAGDYAFNAVVLKGSVNMFEVMLNKHQNLLNLSPHKTWAGLVASTDHGNREMAWYLYNIPEKKKLGWSWTDAQRCLFFVYCIEGDMLDVALKVVSMGHLKISKSINTWMASLEILARRPDAFNKTETGWIWGIVQSLFFHLKKKGPDRDEQALMLLKIILKSYPDFDSSDEIVSVNPVLYNEGSPNHAKRRPLYRLIDLAAQVGNTIFVIELLKTFPYLVWARNENNQSIFHIAVMHRHIDIYNLAYEIGSRKDIIFTFMDGMDNNILHLVGMTSGDVQFLTLSAASLLMQRELLWFKEVENMISPRMRISKNRDGLTPYELFSENNQELVSKGLKWTKDCMVVSTLIITIAFAVALTVPGGYHQDSGIPILKQEARFIIFMIADAVSLFSSSTSLLVFLSIVTSPYGQRDFLYSLPRKLIIGLLTLFISVAAMMVTFAAAFFVLYRNTHEWLPITISILAATPVFVFAKLQYPLLTDMLLSTYDSRYLFKPKRRVLYNVGKKL